MIMKITNSKRHSIWRSCYTRISFGYTCERMDWKNGHFTEFKTFHFLFWSLCFNQSFIDTELQS